MKNERLKVSTLLNELAAIKSELKKVSTIIESRLIGLEKPIKDEIRSIREFEARKKKGKLKLIPLVR